METKRNVIRFRVTNSEASEITSLVGTGCISSSCRNILLDLAREHEDPGKRKISIWNKEVKEIDEKINVLSAKREVLIGLIEREMKK